MATIYEDDLKDMKITLRDNFLYVSFLQCKPEQGQDNILVEILYKKNSVEYYLKRADDHCDLNQVSLELRYKQAPPLGFDFT